METGTSAAAFSFTNREPLVFRVPVDDAIRKVTAKELSASLKPKSPPQSKTMPPPAPVRKARAVEPVIDVPKRTKVPKFWKTKCLPSILEFNVTTLLCDPLLPRARLFTFVLPPLSIDKAGSGEPSGETNSLCRCRVLAIELSCCNTVFTL